MTDLSKPHTDIHGTITDSIVAAIEAGAVMGFAPGSLIHDRWNTG